MANNRDSLKVLEEIKQAQYAISLAEKDQNLLIEIRNKKIREQKLEISKLGKELKKINQQSLESFGSAEESISSISGIYKNLQDSQRKGLGLQQGTLAEGSKQEKSALKIASINRQISSLSEDETFQRLALTSLRDEEMGIMSKVLDKNSAILKNLGDQNNIADANSNLTKEQVEALNKQKTAADALKSSMQAITETAETFLTNLRSSKGITGLLLIGAGKFAGKLSEVNKELGQVGAGLSGAAGSATILSFAFGDSASNLKALSAEMGGMEDATFGAQLQTSLMANNMGISGTEAATLSGSLARLNGGSLETAGNLAAGASEFAKMNNIPVSQLMGDLANSTEEFALFGKDGGKNILQASLYAGKLGTNMSTISGIADGLLDFESSITKELELGAMLGKNINLDKARQLAMEGDLEGMMKETLNSLGGIDAFNKMDYFQKKATADLLGVSVAELGKMATNQEKAQKVSKLMSGDFSNMGESLKAIVAQAGPKVLDWGGKFLTLSAQAGSAWSGLGPVLGGLSGKLKGLGGLGSKVAESAGPMTKAGLPDMRFNKNKGGGLAKMTKGGGIGGMMKGMGGGLKGMASGFAAFANPATLLGLAAITAGIIGIGFALKIAAPGIESLGKAIGSVVESVGNAVKTIIGGLGDFFMKVASVATPELALSILGLGVGFYALTGSLAAFAIAGIAAIPAMLAVSAFGAASDFLGMGDSGKDGVDGTSGTSLDGSETPAWVEELKTTFRETKDVYMDGTKVTSVIRSKVSKVGSNTYAI